MKAAVRKIWISGGSGLLGRTLILRLMADGMAVMAPPHVEVDILDYPALSRSIEDAAPDLLIHLAALSTVTETEANPRLAWAVNVEGTGNVLKAAAGRPLVFVSSDYVFDGLRGMYREGDERHPLNVYGRTKAAAEDLCLQADRTLVVRTSFKPSVWPHPAAFADQWTTAVYVDEAVEMLLPILWNFALVLGRTRILHVGGVRRTALDLACERNPGIAATHIADTRSPIPREVSLDTSLWHDVSRGFEQNRGR